MAHQLLEFARHRGQPRGRTQRVLGAALRLGGRPGHLGGAPAEQALFAPLRDAAEAARVWEVSEQQTGIALPAARA